MTLDFSRPENRTDNVFSESFSGRLPAERLNENGFLSPDDTQKKIAAGRQDDNNHQSHSSPGDLAPGEFAPAGRNSRPG